MTMEEKIDLILRLLQDRPTVAVASTSVAVADAADLDSGFGDPEIKMSIPAFRWPGEQHKGKRMSQTGDAAYLLALATQLEWSASKDDADGKVWTSTKTGEVKPAGDFNRRDAARARGWAQRIKDRLVHVDAVTSGDLF